MFTGIDLRNALSCVLNEGAGSGALRDINDMVNHLESRLTSTNRLLDLLESKRQSQQNQQSYNYQSNQIDQYGAGDQTYTAYSDFNNEVYSNYNYVK